MSRSGYVDDYEHISLYRHAVDVAIKGKRGQRFIRRMLDALMKLPERRLTYNDLISDSGDVCAMGAICKIEGLEIANIDQECPEDLAEIFNIASSLAAEIFYVNDEEGPYKESESERWTRVVEWCENQMTPGGANEA